MAKQNLDEPTVGNASKHVRLIKVFIKNSIGLHTHFTNKSDIEASGKVYHSSLVDDQLDG